MSLPLISSTPPAPGLISLCGTGRRTVSPSYLAVTEDIHPLPSVHPQMSPCGQHCPACQRPSLPVSSPGRRPSNDQGQLAGAWPCWLVCSGCPLPTPGLGSLGPPGHSCSGHSLALGLTTGFPVPAPLCSLHCPVQAVSPHHIPPCPGLPPDPWPPPQSEGPALPTLLVLPGGRGSA